ncbi:MAG: CARDB domain-containing protein [Zavarzinella sp.]
MGLFEQIHTFLTNSNPQTANRTKIVLKVENLEDRSVPAVLLWDGGGDGTSWSDARNWVDQAALQVTDEPLNAPGVDDHAIIDMAGAVYTVRVDSDIVVDSITMNSTSAELDINGRTLTVTNELNAQSNKVIRLTDGTLNAGEITNNGLFTALKTSSVSADNFTNFSTVQLVKSAAQGAVLLNFNGEMHNEGLVNFLLSGSNNVNASLILSEGSTLVNEADGEILMGSGTGTSILQGTVDNFGTINILEDNSKINGVGTVLNNHGTVNVASTGRLFGENATYNQIAGVFNNERDVRLENNGTFNMSGGVLNENSAGSEIFHVKNLIISGGDHNGRAIVVTNGTAHFAAEAPNDANVQLRQSNTVSGTLVQGQTLTVLKQTNLGSTTTFENFANSGLVRFAPSKTTESSTSVANGSIQNNLGGMIEITTKLDFSGTTATNAGTITTTKLTRSGGTFTNSGHIELQSGGEWSVLANSHFHHTGTIANNTTFKVFGEMIVDGDIANSGLLETLTAGSNPPGTLTYVSGIVSGNHPTITSAKLNIQGNSPQDFRMRGASTLEGTLAQGQTLTAVSNGTTPPIIVVDDSALINGKLLIDNTGANTDSRLQSTNSGSVKVGSTGEIVFEATNRTTLLEAPIANEGTITVDGRATLLFGRTLSNTGMLNLNAGSQMGGGTIEQLAGSWNIDPTAIAGRGADIRYLGGNINGIVQVTKSLELGENAGNSGTFVMESGSSVKGVVKQGQTLILGPGSVNAIEGLRNEGTIIFQSPENANTFSQLELGQATFTNATTGVLRVQHSNQTALFHQANIFNEGTIIVESGRLDYRGFFTNTGNVIIEEDGKIIASTNAEGFFMDGGTIENNGEFRYLGGSFEFNGGNILDPIDVDTASITFATNLDSTTTINAKGIRLLSNIPDGITLNINSDIAGLTTSVETPEGFVNHGIINVGTNTSISTVTLGHPQRKITNLGTININGTGARTVRGTLDNQGTINAASNWILDGSTTKNHLNSGIINSSATTTIRGASFLNETTGTINASGSLIFKDAFANTKTVSAGKINIGTTGAAAQLNITGDIELTSTAALNFDIGGEIPGTEHDRLNITGKGTLNGVANFDLINGHVPAENSAYVPLTYTSKVNDFALYTGLNSGITQVFQSTATATELQVITVAPGFDIRPQITSVASNGISGQAVQLSYDVINNGLPIVGQTWKDRIYISSSATFDPRFAFLVKEVTKSADIAQGDTISETVSVDIPGVNPGNYFWHIVSDVNQVIADSNRSNNVTTSTSQTFVTADQLGLGETITGNIKAGQNFYWELELTQAEATMLDLVMDKNDAIRMFISQDEMPSNWNFDFESERVSATNATHQFKTDELRKYFVHLRANPSAGADGTNYSLSWFNVPLTISSVTSNKGSNLGNATVVLNGTSYREGAHVQLIGQNGVVVRDAIDVTVIDSEKLEATFNLTGEAAGLYNLRVIVGTEAADCGGNCYEVVSTVAGSFSTNITLPDVAVGRIGTGSVTFKNNSNTDLEAPIFLLEISNGLLGFDDCFDASCMSETKVFFVDSGEGNRQFYRPGESGTIFFNFTVPNDETFRVTVKQLDDATPLPAEFVTSLFPATFTEEQINFFAPRLSGLVGDTFGSFHSALARKANDLAEFGAPGTTNINTLVQSLVGETTGFGSLSSLANGTNKMEFINRNGRTDQQILVSLNGFQIHELVNNCQVSGEQGILILRGEGFFQPDPNVEFPELTIIILINRETGEQFEVIAKFISENELHVDLSSVNLGEGLSDYDIHVDPFSNRTGEEFILRKAFQLKSFLTPRPPIMSSLIVQNFSEFGVSGVQFKQENGLISEISFNGYGFAPGTKIEVFDDDGNLVFFQEGSPDTSTSISYFGLSIDPNNVRKVTIVNFDEISDDFKEIEIGISDASELADIDGFIPILEEGSKFVGFSTEVSNSGPPMSSFLISNNCLQEGAVVNVAKILGVNIAGITQIFIGNATTLVPIDGFEISTFTDENTGRSFESLALVLPDGLTAGEYFITIDQVIEGGNLIRHTISKAITIKQSPSMQITSPTSFGEGVADATHYAMRTTGGKTVATIGGVDILVPTDEEGEFVSTALLPITQNGSDLTFTVGNFDQNFDSNTGTYKGYTDRSTGEVFIPTFFNSVRGLISTLENATRVIQSFKRDAQGKVVEQLIENAQTGSLEMTRYGYNSAGQMSSLTTPDGKTSNFTYNENNQVTGITNSEGGSCTLEYDPTTLYLIKSIENISGGEFTLSYSALGLLQSVTLPDGTELTEDRGNDNTAIDAQLAALNQQQQEFGSQLGNAITNALKKADDFMERITACHPLIKNVLEGIVEIEQVSAAKKLQKGQSASGSQRQRELKPASSEKKSTTEKIIEVINTVQDYVEITESGEDATTLATKDGQAKRAVDPNDILGPSGVGDLHHLMQDETLQYTIRFENIAEATAPAQEVFITQTLDSDLDFSTYRLEEFGFGDIRIQLPGDSNSIRTIVDLTESRVILVRVSADINELTGQIRWIFESQDPETGALPANPLLGFLPPNVIPGEGEGFVRYSIRTKADRISGDRIDAAASIVFDVNEAIATPPIFNTIDAGEPSATMNALAERQTSETFTISWTGTDDVGGSGVAHYDVYVSENGGEYVKYLDDTTATSAEFTGTNGSSYQFFVVATDLVGFEQPQPSVPQASTTVALPTEGTAELVDGNLIVTGTSGDDDIIINRLRRDLVKVKINGEVVGTFFVSGKIQANGLDGDDLIRLEENVLQEAILLGGNGDDKLVGGKGFNYLDGGAGDDVLHGNAGDDILIGGTGDDKLHGDQGNDILIGGSGDDVLDGDNGHDLMIGGSGEDNLRGGSGDDILIGGTTTWENNPPALTDILSYWASQNDYEERVLRLSTETDNDPLPKLITIGSAPRVFDDHAKDKISGDGGEDWFFVNLTKPNRDSLTDYRRKEIIHQTDAAE